MGKNNKNKHKNNKQIHDPHVHDKNVDGVAEPIQKMPPKYLYKNYNKHLPPILYPFIYF